MTLYLYYCNADFDGPLCATVRFRGDGTPGTITFEDFDEAAFPAESLRGWRNALERTRNWGELHKLLDRRYWRRELPTLQPWTRELVESHITYEFSGLWLRGVLVDEG